MMLHRGWRHDALLVFVLLPLRAFSWPDSVVPADADNDMPGAGAGEDDEVTWLQVGKRQNRTPTKTLDLLSHMEGVGTQSLHESYPRWVHGAHITAQMQELMPQVGACYWSVSDLQDAVLLYRQREWAKALRLLDNIDGSSKKIAQQLSINIGQMYDRFDVISDRAEHILHHYRSDPHALFVQALYSHAFGHYEKYRSYASDLHDVSPASWKVLDRTVNDVVMAWSSFKQHRPYSPHDLPDDWKPEKIAIVVFGCSERCLQERLAAARDVSRKLPHAQIIASGGAGSSSNPEGTSMKASLVSHGVEASRIFADSSARDTLGSSIFVAGWLRQNDAQQVIIVTSTWHVTRAHLLLAGLLEQLSVTASITLVGAGNAGYDSRHAYEDRLDLERKASYRDTARARGFFSACDF